MIYKPTDLSPSAQTFDVMDTPIFFECKVDTSNVQASGFTIEILDSENNVVFSSIPEGEQLNINYITIIDDLREYVHAYFPDYETGYSLLNTGYNGSYLKFPFSVVYDSRANNTSAINQIFYIPDPNGIVKGLTEDEVKISSGLYKYNYIWTTGDNPEYIIDINKPLIPVKIYNGKEYKWSITLYQLDNVGTTKNPVWILPENPLMFDMPMTTGTVLGSNNKRIQSAFSEEIYGDYFIQPLKIDGLNYNIGEEDKWTYSGAITQIGKRVMIKSYDMSFGYIYPMEGDDGIPEGDIVPDRANAFRIYKRGNNPDDLTDYQKVSYVLEDALVGDDPSNKDAIITLEWKTSLANAGESYYEQKWSGVIDQSGAYTPPGFPPGILVYPNERIVLNGQGGKDESGKLIPSAFNGIYYPQFSSEALESAPIYSGKTGVTINIDLPNTFSNEFNQNGSYTLTYNGSVWQCNDKNYSCNVGDGVVTIGDAGLKIIYQNSTTVPSVGDSITFTIKHQIVARWIRTPDADTWGELVNKIVMVTRAGSPYFGKNIQIIKKEDADPEDKTGTINQTEFTFTEELPVNIYAYDYDSTNPDRNNIGLIFYNEPIIKPNNVKEFNSNNIYNIDDIVEVESGYYKCIKRTSRNIQITNNEYWRELPKYEGNKNGILYIRYFEGIQKGMMLQKLSSDNKYQYFIIDDVGTNGGMYLKYHEVKEFDTYKSYTISNTIANANPTKLTEDTTWDIDETKYQIKTYFRESDENAFYFYSRPIVDIQFENTAGVNFVTGRTPYVAATIWEAGRTYHKGDYVYVNSDTRKYFLCLSESGVTSDTAPSITDANWELLTTGINVYENNVNYKKDTIVSYNNIYYIALTNISQSAAPVAPKGKNLGIFWETYVGTLYKEDRGFDYSLYNNLKAYKADDIVFDQGIYYIVLKDIKSKTPTENTNLWDLFTDIYDGIVYPYKYFGFYNGKCYQCINEAGSNGFVSSNWALVTDVNGDEQYKDGLRVNIDDSLYTDFISNEVYTVERTVFYNGLKYQMRILQFNANTNYNKGEYVMTGGQDNPKYYLCTNNVSGADKKDPSEDTAHWREMDTVNTAPLLEDPQYYGQYNSWKDTELYDEGELVLYNNKYYVYINDNRNKKNIYRTELSYKVGDLAKILDNGVYRWKYCKIANPQGQLILNNWTDIIPDNIDGTYKSDEFWTEYYGFLYVGDYNENTHTIGGNVESYVNYYYNNVVYYNNQYYIYQNPNLNGVSFESFRGPNINTSLDKLNNNIPKYKAGEPGYNIGDIVLYDDKYYICYKATTTDYFSPANRNYWALYPWQTFITEISERTVVCNCEYRQQQYVQWKSVQWFLYDATGENILDKSDVIYDGDLTYTFHGVDGREKVTQDDVIFIIRLVLETRTGYRLTIDKKIKAVYEIEEINSQGLIDAYFDCDTMSVVAVVTKESGFIIPTIEGNETVVTYAEGDSYGEMTVDGEVDYAKVLYSLESASAVAYAADIISDSERFELQSSQKIDTDYFSGYVTRVQTAVDSSDDVEWNMQGDFGIFIPEMLQEEDSTSVDDFNKNKSILKLNPERNMIYWEAKDVNNGSYYMGPVKIIENNDNGIILSKEGILTDAYKNSFYETASNYQPKNFINIYGITLAKDNPENRYPNTNYLPITYATYFKDSSLNVGTVNKYNAETPYNVYDTKTFKLVNNTRSVIGMNIKRVQPPLIGRNNFLINANNNANKFDVTDFNVSENDSDTSKLKTEVYFAEVAPTLISDYAYSETYGIPEGLKYESPGGTVDAVPVTYYRQKNVINDFSEVWNEAGNGETEFSSWKDGEYITNGSSLQGEVLGSISINDGAPSTINIPGNIGVAIFSDTMLFLQERLKEDKEDLKIVSERSYLNGKKFIINADLVMDGNGGLTPYPGDTDKAERVVIYTDSDL